MDPMVPNLLVINISQYSSYLENEITLSKKTFVNVHSADNIRDDYLIGKVLGSGKFYLYGSVHNNPILNIIQYNLESIHNLQIQ